MSALRLRVGNAAQDLGRSFAALRARLAEPAPAIVRIGLHGSAIGLRLLRQQARLELRFPATRVEWVEYAEEAPLIEALSAGRLELGLTGCAAPVFAQAEGRRVHYVGAELEGPRRRLVVRVRADSSCASLTDLQGGRLALQRGSDAHHLLARALAEVELDWSDVEPVWLAAAEASEQLRSRRVDAWCSCDIEHAFDSDGSFTRDLAAPFGLSVQRCVYVASPGFAALHPQALLTVIDELKETETWCHSNPGQAARLLVDADRSFPCPLELLRGPRSHSSVAPLTAALVADQQRLADDMLSMRLMDAPVLVDDHVWRPPG